MNRDLKHLQPISPATLNACSCWRLAAHQCLRVFPRLFERADASIRPLATVPRTAPAIPQRSLRPRHRTTARLARCSPWSSCTRGRPWRVIDVLALPVDVSLDWTTFWGLLQSNIPASLPVVPTRLALMFPDADTGGARLVLGLDIVRGVFAERPSQTLFDHKATKVEAGSFGLPPAHQSRIPVSLRH